MFGLGTWELIVILVVLLLLFGSRLPSVMRSLGRSATEFKKGMNEITDEAVHEEKTVSADQLKDEKPSDETPAG